LTVTCTCIFLLNGAPIAEIHVEGVLNPQVLTVVRIDVLHQRACQVLTRSVLYRTYSRKIFSVILITKPCVRRV
jgi:hypothetical protein